MGGGAATSLLIGLNLLLLIMQVPQHISRVLFTPLIYGRVLRVNVCSFKTQQLLNGEDTTQDKKSQGQAVSKSFP